MKICLIGDANSIHIRRWAGWLRQKGHFVSIISLTRVADNWPEYDYIRYIPPKSGFMAYARRTFPVAQAVREIHPDIIHGHFLTSAGAYAVFSVSDTHNVVVSAWGSDVYSDAKYRLKRFCIKYALKHSKVVLADSVHLVSECKKLVPSADVRKVLFGIDTKLFKPNPIKHDRFRFLSLRVTSSIYNPMVIVKAFDQANLDAELWIQKPSPDCFDVYDYVKAMPALDRKVTWLDKKPYEQMPELYNSVDVGISIPNWDSSSTAVNECMASGIPVIASDIAQNREWIRDAHTWEEGNGFLTSIDVFSLKLKMEEAMLSQLIKDGKGQRGFWARKTILENADFNTEMSKAEKIYEEVLDGKA